MVKYTVDFSSVLQRSNLKIRKIAILRANALGDFIFSLPACEAIRNTFPHAEIILLAKNWHKMFLSNRPCPFDRVIEIPQFPGVGEKENFKPDKSELHRFFASMQHEKFDIAIQLHGGGRYSNQFVLKLKARITVGTQTNDAALLSYTIPYHYYQSEYMRWLEVASLIGAHVTSLMPRIKVTIHDIQEAKQKLGKNTKNIIVLHPGANDIKRRWPVERFAQLGDYFAQKGYRIIITGSADEGSLVREVVRQMDYPSENFFNKVSLNGLTGLLSLSKLIISNDTGPLHLATAIGTKTVGLYWCGNIINGSPPFRHKHIVLSSWIIHCPLCNHNCASYYPFEDNFKNCTHNISFVSNISTKDVISASNSLLEKN